MQDIVFRVNMEMMRAVLRIGLFCWGISLWPGEVASQAVIIKEPGTVPVPQEKDLTDQERHQSQTFVNEALGNKIVREECAKLDDPKACEGQGEGFKVLGLDSQMISYVAKAYSMLMGGMYKGGLDGKVPETGTASDKPEDKDDICALIGAGAETVGMAMQQLSSKTIMAPTGGGTDQKKILYKAARSHRDRAKTAGVQAAGWGGASACYVYMMTHGGAALNSRKNLLKTAAAGLLTAFYFKERLQQKKYSEQVKKIADKLPNKGDCNPITETDCYCSLEEYQNDPKYCVPYLHKKKLAQGSIVRVACTDNKLRADPQCQCAVTDTCLDKVLKNDFVSSKVGPGFVLSPVGKDVVALSRGELSSGPLTSSALGRNAGLNNFFRQKKGEMSLVNNLSPKREREASLLREHFGLPVALARHLVAAPAPLGMAAAMGKFSGKSAQGVGPVVPSNKRGGGQILSFRGGEGLRGGKRTRQSSSSGGFDFKKYLTKGRKKNSLPKGSILEFNQRAINSAEVSKNPQKNIFHIISKRYMLWGVRR